MTDQPIPDSVLKALATGEVKPADKPQFIIAHKQHFNQDGLQIDETEVISGTLPPNFPRFIARVVVTVELPVPADCPANQEKPKHKQPVQVPIDAATIVEAYEKAPALLQETANRFQQHFNEYTTTEAGRQRIASMLKQAEKK